MNVLSLFDGMSCGQIALERAGIKVDKYYASEIDKYAIQITQKNYPNTIQLGDVTKVKNLKNIDLLMGGSPCQGFSFAGKQLNFDDPRSALFFEFVRLLKETKPKYFLLENVRMKQEYQDVISEYLGVKPIMINSYLVSAQNRVRLYWTNIPNVKQPKDKGLVLSDILEDYDEDLKPIINPEKMFETQKYWQMDRNGKGYKSLQDRIRKLHYPSNTLAAHSASIPNIPMEGLSYRKALPIECERLQTVPDYYTKGVSKSQRYRMLGNGWTVDVIAHILGNIDEKI